MNDSLTFLLEKSKNNKELTERIYATRNGRNPVNALCELSTAEGFPITAAELLYDGEETCAAMCRRPQRKITTCLLLLRGRQLPQRTRVNQSFV